MFSAFTNQTSRTATKPHISYKRIGETEKERQREVASTSASEGIHLLAMI